MSERPINSDREQYIKEQAVIDAARALSDLSAHVPYGAARYAVEAVIDAVRALDA